MARSSYAFLKRWLSMGNKILFAIFGFFAPHDAGIHFGAFHEGVFAAFVCFVFCFADYRKGVESFV